MPIHDLDNYGRLNADGSLMVMYDDDCLKIALINWLTSKKGDFVMSPDEGGVLDSALFKNLTNSNQDLLYFAIQNQIVLNFSNYLTLTNISINQEYEIRALEISITFKSKLTNNLKNASLYLDTRINSESFVFENVNEIGTNLENFVLIKKASMGNRKLMFNIEEDSWVWGRYKFVNFNTGNPEFSRILSLINLT